MSVPHYYQSSPQSCGPASLRMLCASLGHAHDESTIAQKCGLTPYGCTIQDLVAGAQALGLNAALLPVSGGPSAVAVLSNQTPFVVMIDLASLDPTLPMLTFHCVVPLAVVQDEVVYHDPADGPDRRAKLDDFLAAWATAGYRGVHVWTP